MRYLILSFFLVLFCRPASLRGGQKGEHQKRSAGIDGMTRRSTSTERTRSGF